MEDIVVDAKLMRKVGFTKRAITYAHDKSRVGTIRRPTVIGKAQAWCGDEIAIYLRIINGIIKLATFETTGCAAAQASGSALTKMVIGKTVSEARRIDTVKLLIELGASPDIKKYNLAKIKRKGLLQGLTAGIIPTKIHCAEMTVDALKEAIKKYRSKG